IGYEVDAWDVSETAIDRARTLSKDCGATIRFIAGNAIQNAMYRTDTYDLILDFLFLHHVQDRDIEAYFDGVRNSIQIAGHYVVGVFMQTDDVVKRSSFFSDGKVRYWTKSGIEEHLGSNFMCDSTFYGNAGSPDHNYPIGVFLFVKRELYD
ncbi:MAG: class I SAM-dependent methyltransferase, partial [Rectinemataceae bacterium]|nr:class I SAM-dependent methyltransferase [Rectinemataceae bacterium]